MPPEVPGVLEGAGAASLPATTDGQQSRCFESAMARRRCRRRRLLRRGSSRRGALAVRPLLPPPVLQLLPLPWLWGKQEQGGKGVSNAMQSAGAQLVDSEIENTADTGRSRTVGSIRAQVTQAWERSFPQSLPSARRNSFHPRFQKCLPSTEWIDCPYLGPTHSCK